MPSKVGWNMGLHKKILNFYIDLTCFHHDIFVDWCSQPQLTHAVLFFFSMFYTFLWSFNVLVTCPWSYGLEVQQYQKKFRWAALLLFEIEKTKRHKVIPSQIATNFILLAVHGEICKTTTYSSLFIVIFS